MGVTNQNDHVNPFFYPFRRWDAPASQMSDEERAEYVADAQADEAETDDWLATWSDDFHSDEWLAAVLNPQQAVPIS